MGDDGSWVDAVLAFWFDELEPKQWFVKSADTDALITERFRSTFDRVSLLPDADLTGDARCALGAVIVLDQFPRNMFRGTPQAFGSDAKALAIARRAVELGFDQQFSDKTQRVFFYLPFEHSERLEDQDRSVVLILALGDAEYTRYAEAHRDVIREFGRFPHRNAVLGRASTPAEEDYLAKPGSGF